MPNTSWVLNDFSGQDTKAPTLYLELEGVSERFVLSQFSMTFAINEIPRAACLVAIGRDGRRQGAGKAATIHQFGVQLGQMRRAKVYFTPSGPWEPVGSKRWKGTKVIFDGYYVGLAYRKISDKVQPVLHLIHWLCDLGFSSVLSAYQFPGNPTSLVFPLAQPPLAGAGEGTPPKYVGPMAGFELIHPNVKSDLWGGIKAMLYALADEDKFNILCGSPLSGSGEKKSNVRAQAALQRIEGAGVDAKGKAAAGALKYQYGRPLKLDTQGISLVEEGVSLSICSQQQCQEQLSQSTFWDMVVGIYGPMFNFAIVPMVDRALVVADCPTFRKAWKVVGAGEYDDFDLSGMISQPLQGVGVYGEYNTMSGYNVSELAQGGNVCIGGHYAAKAPSPSRDTPDGAWMVVAAPAWLASVPWAAMYTGDTSGLLGENPSQSCTTPCKGQESEDPSPSEINKSGLSRLCTSYAKAVYQLNTMRGRGAPLSGKLRFDIAPGSVIKIESKSEAVDLQGCDQLAVDMFASVQRVSCNINAEAKSAGTSFQLTHLRTSRENTDERTSTDAHPLFGSDIYNGGPLVDKDWAFK